MKSNKGFTLIELLAVIVILAIIALIATPIILGIIEDSRNQSKQRTAELIASEIQLAYSGYMLKQQPSTSPDAYCTYMTNEFFSMDGASITTTCTGSAAAESKTVVVTAGSDVYNAVYNDGTVTVTLTTDSTVTTDAKLRNATPAQQGGGE